jgi:NAD(P)H dehydrogenase (quinone)
VTKVLIIYDSQTGNTEKMALQVLKGVKEVTNAKPVLKKVDQATLEDLETADAIIMGSPTYYGQMSGKLKTFIDSSNKIHGKLAGKAGGAFTSSGGAACGAETTLISILNAMLVHGMIVQGIREYNHYGPAAVGAPGERETKLCRLLGKRVAELAARLVS